MHKINAYLINQKDQLPIWLKELRCVSEKVYPYSVRHICV